MKNHSLRILAVVFQTLIAAFAFSQTQTWAWKSGSSGLPIVVDFGTRGEFQPSNRPPALQNAAMWTDQGGNIYLFGGDDGSGHNYNTIWKFNPTLDQWMWVRGANTTNAAATYNGTIAGYPSETNDPGARTQFAWSAAPNGDLWVYGGVDQASNVYADIWKYDLALDRWIWYAIAPQGVNSPTMNRDNDYGVDTLGSLGDAGSRSGASMYVNETEDTLWLFGGETFTSGSPGLSAEVWRIDLVEAKEYFIGARYGAASWMTSDGQLVIYGGYGYGAYNDGFSSARRVLNDMWLFNTTTGIATWVAGGDTGLTVQSLWPKHGTMDVAADTVYPGARFNASAAKDANGNVWFFGGKGYSDSGTAGIRNDFFKLSTPATNVFAAGSGTSQDPYRIASLSQLQSANDYRDKYFALTSDIDASATATWNLIGLVYPGFQPIGSDASPFTGYLEGNGHTISGLTVNRGSASAVGMFGRIDGIVRNLRLRNVFVVGDAFVGGLAGRIVGQVDSCSVTGTVTGSGNAVGGLSGDVFSGSLTMSYAAAAVTGGVYSGTGTGGLVGSVSSGSTLSNVYATGNVAGNNRVGGLVGNNSGTITKSYASGFVAGDSLSGGLAGANTGTVTQSYWSPATSGQNTSAAGTSLALAGLESQGSFLGYDFGNTWVIWEGLSYPAFRSDLQSPPPGLSGVALKITANNTRYQFGANHVDLKFLGIPVDSILFVYAGYENTQADSIAFAATPPTYYSAYRWLIGKAGSTYTGDTLFFTTISSLPGAPDPATIVVYRRSAEGTGSFSSVTASTSGDTIVVPNAAFGEYIFGSNSAPLSVMISQFTGIGNLKGADLRWATVTEVNNVGWQIERSVTSVAGLSGQVSPLDQSAGHWTDVGLVRGAGTSNAPRQYSYADVTLPGRYSYRLKQLDQAGNSTFSRVIQVDVGLAPKVFDLSQNYPNPFNPTTTIRFTLAHDGRAVLKVYDILGREIATLLDGDRKAGEIQQVVFDGTMLASGVYFVRLESQGRYLLKKMLLMK